MTFEFQAGAGLEVISLGQRYAPDPNLVVIQQSVADQGGDTSIRNTSRALLKWKPSGYYQRNRDIGQVFTAERDFQLEAIVLRTGPSSRAVMAGAPGSKVFLQFFSVTGEPRINDNGTPPGSKAEHGFGTHHRCDDFIEGVSYESLRVVHGGVFPELSLLPSADGMATNTNAGNLAYLRWQVTGEDRIKFEAGKRYAFMVGIEEPGQERGFTLANVNLASVDAPPSLIDKFDRYHGGWGLRREGDGTVPPLMIAGEYPPTNSSQNEKLIQQSLFAEGAARFQLPPTTDGYPDVDTYRDLEFYLEVSPSVSAGR